MGLSRLGIRSSAHLLKGSLLFLDACLQLSRRLLQACLNAGRVQVHGGFMHLTSLCNGLLDTCNDVGVGLRHFWRLQ